MLLDKKYLDNQLIVHEAQIIFFEKLLVVVFWLIITNHLLILVFLFGPICV